MISRGAYPAVWTSNLVAALHVALDYACDVLAVLADVHLGGVAESEKALVQVR